MRHLRGTERQGELVETLKDFLNTQSTAPAKTRYCPQCGSVLRYLPTQFWLEGAENGWNIRLPYCAHCHPFPLTKETIAA
jgi:hypothetical protein